MIRALLSVIYANKVAKPSHSAPQLYTDNRKRPKSGNALPFITTIKQAKSAVFPSSFSSSSHRTCGGDESTGKILFHLSSLLGIMVSYQIASMCVTPIVAQSAPTHRPLLIPSPFPRRVLIFEYAPG